jgi:hypothetical protein
MGSFLYAPECITVGRNARLDVCEMNVNINNLCRLHIRPVSLKILINNVT